MHPLRLNELMALLTAATGRAFSEDDIAGWLLILGDLPDETIEAGFARACAECEAFPSPALIRRLGTEVAAGTPDLGADAFARVAEAVRRFGPCLPCSPRCDRCREDAARRHVGEVAWKAVQGLGGWSAVCDSPVEQRGTLRAQFRDAYRAEAERENRDRLLPADLRSRIDNTPVRGIPQAAPAAALPAPPQPSEEAVERAKRLRIFRDAEERRPPDLEAQAARREALIEQAKALAAQAAKGAT